MLSQKVRVGSLLAIMAAMIGTTFTSADDAKPSKAGQHFRAKQILGSNYTVEQYPVFSTPSYRSQVYKYYGLTPAEQRRVIRRGGVVVPK